MPKFFYTSVLINILSGIALLYVITKFPPTNVTKLMFLLILIMVETFSIANISFFKGLRGYNLAKENTQTDPRKMFRTKIKKSFFLACLMTIPVAAKIYIFD